VIWSPYQRISWRIKRVRTNEAEALLKARVFVNYQYHQQIVNFAIVPRGRTYGEVKRLLLFLDHRESPHREES